MFVETKHEQFTLINRSSHSVRQTENIGCTLFPGKENGVQGNQMTCLRSYGFE